MDRSTPPYDAKKDQSLYLAQTLIDPSKIRGSKVGLVKSQNKEKKKKKVKTKIRLDKDYTLLLHMLLHWNVHVFVISLK